jgi:hypothetical protein
LLSELDGKKLKGARIRLEHSDGPGGSKKKGEDYDAVNFPPIGGQSSMVSDSAFQRQLVYKQQAEQIFYSWAVNPDRFLWTFFFSEHYFRQEGITGFKEREQVLWQVFRKTGQPVLSSDLSEILFPVFQPYSAFLSEIRPWKKPV